MFHRHGKCFGICLFKTRKLYVELWICAPKYSIEEHFHSQQDNGILFLFGKVKFCKRYTLMDAEKVLYLSFLNICSGFLIEKDCWHRFINLSNRCPLIFINVARFISGYDPKSASKDFYVI